MSEGGFLRKKISKCVLPIINVWRYQRGNQTNNDLRYQRGNQTNNDLQSIQKKTKDRATITPLKTGGELRCSGRVSSSCSTSSTFHVNLVTNPVMRHECGNDREVFMANGTYPWSFVTQIFHNGQPSHGGDRKIFKVMTST